MNGVYDELPGFCCGERMITLDSRPKQYGIRRRRKCRVCDKRESSIEIPLPDNAQLDSCLQEDLTLLGDLTQTQRAALRVFLREFSTK